MVTITKKRVSACLIGRRYIYTLPENPDETLVSTLKDQGRCRTLALGKFKKWFIDNKFFILQFANDRPAVDGRFKRAVWKEGVEAFEALLAGYFNAEIREMD